MSLARCAVAAVSVSCWLSAACSCRSKVVSALPSSFIRGFSQEVSSRPQCNMYVAEERGSLHSPDYRIYFRDESGPISPVHDIPMYADKDKKLFNMVVEVPRWSNAKMEMSMTETLNPIKQDTKKGALRFVANVFPHHGYIWNYGAIPQTWESPKHCHSDTQARGDNDPIDVIEIGHKVRSRGDVVPIKVLGVMALLDEGETDWKVIGIAADEPDAALLHDVADLHALRPGLLRATAEWFRLYKVPDGKPENKFAFDGQAKDAAYALKIIDEVHAEWESLVGGEGAGGEGALATGAVLCAGAARRLPRDAAAALLAAQPPRAAPHPPPAHVDKWHYLSNL